LVIMVSVTLAKLSHLWVGRRNCPRRRIPAKVQAWRRSAAALTPIDTFGHAGDGKLHSAILSLVAQPDSPESAGWTAILFQLSTTYVTALHFKVQGF
jgi:hypothetical protein